MPATLVAATLVTLTGSSVTAAEPQPLHFPAVKMPKSDPQKVEFDPHSVVVKFRGKSTAAARSQALNKHGGRSANGVSGAYATVTSEATAPTLLARLKAEPAVELVSLDYKRKASAIPNDELYHRGYQGQLAAVRLQQAWDLSKSAGNQTIAVLDTGIDPGHPDLVGRIVGSYNAIHPGWAATDGHPRGHGTFVAGVAAATANNGEGIAGAAWSARLLPVKVLADDGTGYDTPLLRGINWAVSNGARVINMSLGGPSNNVVIQDAIKQATAKGVLFVAAAGNEEDDRTSYPAAYPDVLAVSATDSTGNLTYFSSHAAWVDIAAPGWSITSSIPRRLVGPGYLPYGVGMSGTSFSAPLVAGVAAMVRNKFPTYTPAQVIARLKATARDAGPRGIDPYYGAGVLDAYQALGGPWTPELPMGARGANEPNDLPGRATPVTGADTTGVISTEGDIDYYSIESAAARNIEVSVVPPVEDENRAQTLDAVLSVYNTELQLLGQADGADSRDQTEYLNVSVPAGRSYIAVRNYNGSRDTRPYVLSVAEVGGGSTGVGPRLWIRDTTPVDLGPNTPLNYAPVITFQRDMSLESVNEGTVRILHGKTGAVVPSKVVFEANKATITPNAPLQDNTPYRISVGAVQDSTGEIFTGFGSTFRSVDINPAPVTGFDATGAYTTAALKWSIPGITDLDQVIVRRNAGTTYPPAPNTATPVYGGTASGVTATGLANATTYSFRAWVKDRSGKYSAAVDTQLVGTYSSMTANATALNFGGSVTLSGKAVRVDTKAPLGGVPMSLYGRNKNSSSWREITRVTTSATGTYRVTYKPSASTVFAWGYNGSPDLLGSRTGNWTVDVRPTITANLSPTAFKLGGSTTFYGYVRPQHAGHPVYLQRSTGSTWTTITSTKLNSTGNYGFSIKPTARGSYTYRVVFQSDGDHATAVSPAKAFTVS